MKRILGFTLAAIGAAMLIVTVAQAGTHRPSTGVLVSVRKTALGSVLADARGRTLYLFEKDTNGLSMCNSACTAYWPPLVSHGAPRAGNGVKPGLLTLGRAHQVLYAGHPLYTFIGDKQAGQTTGQGLNSFGAAWYAITASGQKVDRNNSTSSSSSSGSSGGYGY